RARTVGVSNGCRRARQPLRAGGNDFWRASTQIAASGTKELIACLPLEDNRLAGGSNRRASGGFLVCMAMDAISR
ncbi:MAG: hypothetical protein WB994_01875, partial [Candidatus Acidiferrum sp.]